MRLLRADSADRSAQRAWASIGADRSSDGLRACRKALQASPCAFNAPRIACASRCSVRRHGLRTLWPYAVDGRQLPRPAPSGGLSTAGRPECISAPVRDAGALEETSVRHPREREDPDLSRLRPAFSGPPRSRGRRQQMPRGTFCFLRASQHRFAMQVLLKTPGFVIPANAGIQPSADGGQRSLGPVPACARTASSRGRRLMGSPHAFCLLAISPERPRCLRRGRR